MPKKHNKIKKNKNKNKNINKNNNEVHIHLGNRKQHVRRKTIVRKEIVKVPEIKTFTPLHQMTNYVPTNNIPQTYQMTSHPNIPVQQPLLQHNPLVNPLQNITSNNMSLHDERRKQQEEEMNKRIEEYKDSQRKNSGVKIGDVFYSKFPFDSQNITPPVWGDEFSDLEENVSEPMLSFLKDTDELPIRQKDSKPTPKKIEKKSSVEMMPGETEIQWAKRLRDKQEEENRKFHERAVKAYKQLENINEEDIHEPSNKFTKSTRGKKPREIPDDEKQKFLQKDLYRELVTLEREYHDEMFPSYGKSYNRMNKLKGLVEKNKKSGKTF